MFTWERENAETKIRGCSVVTITLGEQDDKTKLTLHQAALETVEDRDAHQYG